MFEGSRAYYNSFDEWKPYGGYGDLRSDTGFSGLVADPLEAHGREMQFAGDALMNYAGTVAAKQTADTNIEISEIAKEKAGSGGGWWRLWWRRLNVGQYWRHSWRHSWYCCWWSNRWSDWQHCRQTLRRIVRLDEAVRLRQLK